MYVQNERPCLAPTVDFLIRRRAAPDEQERDTRPKPLLTYEEWQRREITNPPDAATLERRAALYAEIDREEAECAAMQARTNAVYARAEAAPTEEAGVAIIREYSAELAAEWRARHAA